MESSKTTSGQKAVIIAVASVIIIASAFIYFRKKESVFCFTFLHDTQFGDRKVESPINDGIRGAGGVEYYPVEVTALQTALKKEGFYIDPYEMTGGGVYLTAFFGPSTMSAVRDFQKRHGLEQTGTVENETLDKLNEIYSCPSQAPATSTPTTATTTISG